MWCWHGGTSVWKTRGIWVSSIDWISCADVCEVVVCANILMVRKFCVRVIVVTCVCFGWFSRLRWRVVSKWCFRIRTVLRWSFKFLCVCGGGGGESWAFVSYICTTYLWTPRKLFRGTTNECAREVWEFQRSPSRILSNMVECIIIPEDTNSKPSLTTMDYNGIIIT